MPPHQDLNVALAERHDVAGYGPWSVKAGGAVLMRPLVVHASPLRWAFV